MAHLKFPPFRLDLAQKQLWKDVQQIPLRPQSFAVMYYLVQHAGRLVPTPELLSACWTGRVGTRNALKSCIRDIRLALGDSAESPRFIEAVPKQGYRFIGTLYEDGDDTSSAALSAQSIGREAELLQLRTWLGKAAMGEPQLVFISGEPGIGKTTLIDMFLAQLPPDQPYLLARGQCVEHYRLGEAYMPILSAWEGLCREAAGERCRAILRQYAPSWLGQLPSLLSPAERATLSRELLGVSRERMLGEMISAIDVLAADQLALFILEDLQWSDASTIDFLATLAQRQTKARVLILGTYRPADMQHGNLPLKRVRQILSLHQRCQELNVSAWTVDDIAAYCTRRFGSARFPTALSERLQQHTSGNPLFVVSLLDDLVKRGIVTQSGEHWQLAGQLVDVSRNIPTNLRRFIEQQLQQLSAEEYGLLEAASVAGLYFSAAAVAAGLHLPVEDAEAGCEALARHVRFLQPAGIVEWPDGTLASQYCFRHALYRQVLSEQLPPARRIPLHRDIGQCKAVAYGKRIREIAAELAHHCEESREHAQAVQYYQLASQTALQRSAYLEALDYCTRGLELLPSVPDSPQKARNELLLHSGLGVALFAVKGYATPEMQQSYVRAQELCQQSGDLPQLFQSVLGQWVTTLVRGQLHTALSLAHQLLSLAEEGHDAALGLRAHNILGANVFFLGQFSLSRAHLEQTVTRYDPQTHQTPALLDVQTAAITSRSFLALSLWLLGYPDCAMARSQEALQLAEDSGLPFMRAMASVLAAMVCQYRQEAHHTVSQATEAITRAVAGGFPFWEDIAGVLHAWAQTVRGHKQGALEHLTHAVGVWQEKGALLAQPYFLALRAEAYAHAGRVQEGLEDIRQAFAVTHTTGERWYEAELYRLRGELLLAHSRTQDEEAERSFQQARALAHQQQAKSLELRATTSLARLWRHQGKRRPARTILAEIYECFTEGFETPDLSRAKVLLDALAVSKS